MKQITIILFAFLLVFPAQATANTFVKVATFNVEAGKKASAEKIAQLFKDFSPDIIGFNEVPGEGWTEIVGRLLDMPYSYVGKISSADHKNKYKSILSRAPLQNEIEFQLEGPGRWNPGSAVRAETIVGGTTIAVYSLHVAASRKNNGHLNQLIEAVLSKEKAENVLIVGDFNNKFGSKALNNLESAGYRAIWQDLSVNLKRETSVVSTKKRNKHGVIDHIFYRASPGVKAVKGGLVPINPFDAQSDHKPVWGILVYPQVNR